MPTQRLSICFADARQAIAAAQAIAQYRQLVAHHEIRFDVGVATDEALVTPFGHDSHRIEDIFGDTVIRAMELVKEAHAHSSGVALDDETAKHSID